MKCLLFLLFSLKVLAQNPSIKIEIDSINSIDSIAHRKFTIKYSIENLTNNKISFFLYPERVRLGSSGSMSTDVSAALFQDKEELPIEKIITFSSKFSQNKTPDFESIKDEKERNIAIRQYLKETLDIDLDDTKEEMNESKDDPNYFIKKSNDRLMNSVMTLQPYESRHYSKPFYWDKKRYYKINEMEYYIDEKTNCFLELYIVLLKEEYKGKMLESDFSTIINMPNFIKGWFSSNKKEINFKE